MSPKKRSSQNSDLPTGLTCIKKRGKLRLRFRKPDGSDFWFPETTARHTAIQAVIAYNNKHRNALTINEKNSDKYNKPLKEWTPKVIAVMTEREAPGENKLDTFEKDCTRLKDLHGNVLSKSFNLEHVNDFIDEYFADKSANVIGRKLSFLEKFCDYVIDLGGMETNYAAKKLKPKKEEKKQQRLSLENYRLIYDAAPQFLKTAMELSLQTTHAVLEISRIKYSHCTWYDKPVAKNGHLVHGHLRIHRQKVQHHESSRVQIPITCALKKIIEVSRLSGIVCPYAVHMKKRKSKELPKGLDHWFQLKPEYISRKFSEVRDSLDLSMRMRNPDFKIGDDDDKEFITVKMADWDIDYRPSFHEIRSLSIKLYENMGHSAQTRAAHKNAKTTEIYKEGHDEWTVVPAAELPV